MFAPLVRGSWCVRRARLLSDGRPARSIASSQTSQAHPGNAVMGVKSRRPENGGLTLFPRG